MAVAPTAEPTTDQDAPARVGPMVLDDLERTGAVRFGRPVVRLVVEYEDGGRSILSLPDAAPVDPTEAAILSELGKLRAGEWMKGRTLAASVDLDVDGGHFKGLMARLARPGGRVESSRGHGFRLRLVP
jgi:hypothetical protein